MAQVWVVEFWWRRDDGSGKGEWWIRHMRTRSFQSAVLGEWVDEGYRPAAYETREKARGSASVLRANLGKHWAPGDLEVRVSKYVRA